VLEDVLHHHQLKGAGRQVEQAKITDMDGSVHAGPCDRSGYRIPLHTFDRPPAPREESQQLSSAAPNVERPAGAANRYLQLPHGQYSLSAVPQVFTPSQEATQPAEDTGCALTLDRTLDG
jgi:hypothetical protein